MGKTQQYILAVIVIAVLGVLSFFVVKRNEKIFSPTPQNQTYANTQYGYSFEYPTQYEIDEYTPQQVGLIDTSFSGQEIAQVDVLIASSSGPAQTYENFIHSQARLTCDADGPSGSISCPSIATSSKVVTSSGLSGEAFFLTEVLTQSGQTSTSVAGPFIAFNISSNVRGATYAAILVRPPLIATVATTTTELIESLADSITIQNTQ